MSQEDIEAKRLIWARRAAQHIVDGLMAASEHLDGEDEIALMREIARRALWHLPNSGDEARELVRYIDAENLKRPQPGDDEPPWA